MTATVALGAGLLQLAQLAVDEAPPTNAATIRRRKALTWLEAHGFPTGRDEDWRYLPLAPILTADLQPPDPGAGSGLTSEAEATAPDLGGPRVVVVNGHFQPALSRLAKLPAGVTVTGSEKSVKRTRSTDDASACYRHAFEALNAALATAEVTVGVAPGSVVEEPVHLIYLSDRAGGRPGVSSPRIQIVAGRQSQVRLVETFVGKADGRGLTNAVTTVRCEEGATVWLDRLQDEPRGMWHLSLLDVDLDQDSRLQMCSMALGASVARHEVRVRLAGPRAQVDLDGLYLAKSSQHQDHPILVEHDARDTRSRQLYQGVAGDDGHGVFNGRIVVRPGAGGADAEQVNRNLLLSDRAEIDTRPRLEIFADDVRCTHGATVGRLDTTALYYLRSRGIPLHAAKAMLIHAAVDQAVDRISSTALRADVARRVAAAIEAPVGAA